MNPEDIKTKVSPAVGIVHKSAGDVAVCLGCMSELGPVANGWKAASVRREVKLAKAGGPAYETGSDDVVLRHFYCPHCALLLDTETATPGDPDLVDQIEATHG